MTTPTDPPPESPAPVELADPVGTHALQLVCGDIVQTSVPVATEHYCQTHQATVPVVGVSLIEGR